MTAVFITMPFPGVMRVGEDGAKLGLWELVVLEGERVPIPPADVYILGAWHTQYMPVMSALPTRARLGVCWTSSAAEMELNAPVEFDYLEGLLRDPRIAFVWFGDPGLAQAFPEKGFHYPYPLAFRPTPESPKQDIITLFCPDKPSKNIFAQLLAVAIVQRERPELVLHTNIQYLRGLERRLHVVQHPWLPRPEYHQLQASARLNLACSYSETFCYGALEGLMRRVPTLVSTGIPWSSLETFDQRMVVTNGLGPQAISEKLREIWTMPEAEYGDLADSCPNFVYTISCSNNNEVRERLWTLFSAPGS